MLRIDHAADLESRYVQAFRIKHIFRNFAATHHLHSIDDAVNGAATGRFVEQLLRVANVNYHYISGAGHGTSGTFIGSDSRPIWDEHQNLRQFSGEIIHLCSCYTAIDIGPAVIQKGAAAFWGYTSKFWIPLPPSVPADLETDTSVEPFVRMDTMIDERILNGEDASSVYSAVHNYYLSTRKSLPWGDQVWFMFNFQHLACPVTDNKLGNAAATVP